MNGRGNQLTAATSTPVVLVSMATIYRKTRIGQAEIETRALRLVPRLRNLLIIIDGRRDAESLLALLGHETAAALKELLAYGLIEVAAQHTSSPASAGADAQPPTPPSLPPAGGDTTAFAELRKAAVRALNDALGPAGETLAIRMERTRSEAELRPLLERAAALVASVRGSAAGRAYADRFLGPA